MASLTHTLVVNRRRTALALGAIVAAVGAGTLPVAASANSSQVAIIQDGGVTSTSGSPATTVQQMRALGATTIRVFLPWSAIAPDYGASTKPSFDATDPNAYPAGA